MLDKGRIDESMLLLLPRKWTKSRNLGHEKQRTRIVVEAIAVFAIRDREPGMLYDTNRVGQFRYPSRNQRRKLAVLGQIRD